MIDHIKQIGVVGAGLMGQGVAHAFAVMGLEVILIDINDLRLELARNHIQKNVRLYGFINPANNKISADKVLSKIKFTTDYTTLSQVDYVIENVTENFEIKAQVYDKLDKICQENLIVAVNTSAIPITRLASLIKNPQRVIGIHFMNPVPMKEMVEVIRGVHTSEETLSKTTALMSAILKKSIVVNDWPGFVSNRVLMLMINEAIFLVQDKVADIQDIDRIFKGCFEHKMGPLETADMIGLDTILYSIKVLYENFNDSKYRPCPLLQQMVDAGFLGLKSGKGFYNYQ